MSVPLHPIEEAGKIDHVERWLFALTALASVALFMVPAWPLLTGRVPIYLDLGLFHLPIRTFYSRCLAKGQPFDWIPHLYGGMFLSGEGEHGPYHPLHLILYRFLPLDVAFDLEAFLHGPVLFLGLFAFLRRYLRGTAALLGALCYTFCSGSILHNIYPNYQGVLAHLPWILWLMDAGASTASAPQRRLALTGVALLTGSQLLLGSPQALSFSLFAEALFAVFLLWHRRPRANYWLWWIACNGLGLLIGSVQLLATRDLLAHSTRDGFDPTIGSLRPALLAQLLAPDLLSNHLPSFACSEPLYFGAVPLVLSLWWLSARRPSKDDPQSTAANRLGVFAVVLLGLSAWLALGKYGYLYYLQMRLPLVGQFRLPGRYFTLTALAASILAAVALDRLLTAARSEQGGWWKRLIVPWLGVAAACALAIYFRLTYPKENGSSIHRNYFAGPLFLGVAALMLTAAARGRKFGLFVLVALAVADIEIFSLKAPFWPRESFWGGLPTLAEFNARAEAPPLRLAGRWLDDAFEVPHPVLFNQSVLQGYHGGLEPRKLLDYHTRTALQLANVAWHHLSRYDTTRTNPELRRINELWYQVPDPLPRFRLVGQSRASDDPARDIQTIDIQTTALTTHPLDLKSTEPGSVRLIHEQPGALLLHVEATGSCLLVTADSFDPNWRVFVDESTTPTERVNGDFLGCVVPAGAHEIRFVFRPASIRYGLCLSLVGFGIALSIVAVSCWNWCAFSTRRNHDLFSPDNFHSTSSRRMSSSR